MLLINEQYLLTPKIRQTLVKATRRCLKKLHLAPTKTISVTFCTKAFIQKLNQQYRGYANPTDVLSFPLAEGRLLGDIVIAVPVARHNASQYGNTLTAELQYLIIHGLCHLLGHDHATPKETQKMRRLENMLLQEVAKDHIIVAGRI